MPRAEQFVVQRTRLVGVDDELTIGSQIVGIDDGVTFLRDVNGTNALATAFQELRVANPLAWLDQVNKYEISPRDELRLFDTRKEQLVQALAQYHR